MRRVYGTGVMLLGALMVMAALAADAQATELCLPKKAGGAVLTPKHGKCKKGFSLTRLGLEGKEGNAGPEGRPGAEGKEGKEGKEGPEGGTGFTSEQRETLKLLLPHIRFLVAGVDAKPTIQFSGVNVQIVNGEAMPFVNNGEGNLVIGDDREPPAQTGSENLVVGEYLEYTSDHGIVAGFENSITAPYASVTGGLANHASGASSSVSGGRNNVASEWGASVSGGELNHAEGPYSAIFGGKGLTASAEDEALP